MKLVLLPLTFVLLLAASPVSGAPAASLGPNLHYLRLLHGDLSPVPSRSGSPAARAASAASEEEVQVSIRFTAPPAPSRLDELEARGVAFRRYQGKRLGSATVFPAAVPWRLLDELAGEADILRIESCWRPNPQPPLDVSRPQVEAEIVWTLADETKRPVTGQGVVIADFDTGIDLFHPMFWRADGDTVAWLDENRNGVFDPGVDRVDLDGDGKGGPDEILSYAEAPSHGGVENDPDVFQPSIDWLFLDANGNGVRDYGPAAGFTEADPTFGELVLVALDANRNDRLDPGERLVALGTCKVRAVYETTGAVRRRGVDLIQAEGDYWNHGTPVAGILAGGVPWVHRMAGIAPGAELLMGDNVYLDEPPFIVTLETLIPWAAAEDADIMLYEDGEWVWTYLDGSSNVEIMMNEMAERGIVQIVPAGNLSSGRLHMQVDLAAGEMATVGIHSSSALVVHEMWPAILWRGPAGEVAASLVCPTGDRLTLDGDGTYHEIGSYRVYSYLSVSPRGTAKLDVHVTAADPGGSVNGDWDFELANQGADAVTVHGYNWDDVSSWSGYARWIDHIADKNTTVTWPATADSAIVVGAYRPRGEQILNSFSGRGPRIDGRSVVDLTAPGSIVFAPLRWNDAGEPGGYTSFGGTSAAAPHVAAAVALMLQGWPEAEPGDVRAWLHRGGVRDTNTGVVPNRDWGYGKLRMLAMLEPFAHLAAQGEGAGSDRAADGGLGKDAGAVFLHGLHPNPSDAGFVVEFEQAAAGRVRLELFDVTGRRVALLHDGPAPAGTQAVRWNGRLPGSELAPAPGTYFLRATRSDLSGGGERVAVRKIVLTR